MPSFVEELLTFLSESPTPFHAVQNMSTQLEKGGFKKPPHFQARDFSLFAS